MTCFLGSLRRCTSLVRDPESHSLHQLAFASQLHYVIIASIDIEIDKKKKRKKKKGKENNMRLI